MRNLKKLVALIVTIAMMATFAIPAFAETKTDAEICTDLGVLQGDGSGVTDEYLAKGTTRLQAAILHLRLIGLEAEALAFTGTETFADADVLTWEGGKAILAYLKANPELGWLGDGTNFDPNSAATAQMLYKVMLTALGYEVGTDFEYAGTVTFADGVGLNLKADDEEISNEDTATILVEALKADLKDGSATLVASLVASGMIDLADAEAAGLIEVALTAEVAVTGAKKIEVTFNKAIDDTTEVVVKSGYLSVDGAVTLSEDATVATFTADINFVAGEYTVEITGFDPVTVEIEDEELASFDITTTGDLKISDAAVVAYETINQYGEAFDYDTNAFNISVFNATQAEAITPVVTAGAITLDLDPDAVANDNISVSILELATGKSVTKQFKVVAAASIAQATLGTVAPLANQSRIFYGDEELVLPITMVDQYGDAVALDSTTPDGVTFLSSNPALVDVASITSQPIGDNPVNGYQLEFAVADSAATTTTTVTITALVAKTSKVSSTTITIYPAGALASAAIQQPTALVVAGEKQTLSYVAKDTYGNDITLADASDLIWFSNNDTIVDPDVDITADAYGVYIVPDAISSGKVVITAYLNGKAQSTINLDVKAAAVPSKIKSLSASALTKYAIGGAHTYSALEFVILDQYNRDVTTTEFNYPDDALLSVSAAGAAVVVGGDDLTVTGAVLGEDTLTATYAGKTFNFTVNVIQDGAVVGYAVTELANTLLYTGGGADYTKTLGIANGFDANGNIVAVDGVFDLVLNSDNSVVDLDLTTMSAVTVTADPAAAEGATATVSCWIDGKKAGEYNFTVSTVAPKISALAFDAANFDLADASAVLTANDQYGVAVELTFDGVQGDFYTSDSSVATVDPEDGTVTPIADGTVTITYIANTGAYAQLTFTVDV
jgi:hypothetical protein